MPSKAATEVFTVDLVEAFASSSLGAQYSFLRRVVMGSTDSLEIGKLFDLLGPVVHFFSFGHVARIYLLAPVRDV